MSGAAPHVATIDFAEFYAEAAGSPAASRAFYESLSTNPSDARLTAKIMVHPAARMVWLGDQVDLVARGRPALQIMFYMIAAEAVAKLAADFENEGQSRKHVRLFFTAYCTVTQRERIQRAIEWATPLPRTTPDTVADHLYDLRCDVVHRGRYFEWTLPDDACLREVRAVVLEGVVQAAQKVMEI
jgi:hypothetical protein